MPLSEEQKRAQETVHVVRIRDENYEAAMELLAKLSAAHARIADLEAQLSRLNEKSQRTETSCTG